MILLSSPLADDDLFCRFGYGNHACPGRFYAVRKIKIAFGKLLMDYDFQWTQARQNMSRPDDFAIEAQLIAAPDTELLIRRRSPA